MKNEMKNNNILQRGWVVCVLAVLCNMLWGSAFPAVKKGYEIFQVGAADTAGQILFAGCRFFLAGVLVVLLGSLQGRKWLTPRREDMGRIVRTSLVQTVLQYFFFYVGLAHTTGVKGSILITTNVFFSILVTSLLFRMEKPQLRKMAGCLVGFAGVVLINLDGGGLEMSLNLLGDGFVMLSALSNAFSSVLIKKYSRYTDPVLLNGWQFILGGAMMIAGAGLCGGRLSSVTLPGIAVMGYLSMLSAVAYTLWSLLLKENPISRVAIFGFTSPIFGVILSALILQEGSTFGLRGAVALVLVCLGIVIVNGKREEKSAVPAREG